MTLSSRSHFPIVAQGTPAFEAALGRVLGRGAALTEVEGAVRQTIADVRARGDAALVELTRRFEGRSLDAIEIGEERLAAAEQSVAPDVRAALAKAADRIRAYHEEQLRRETGFSMEKDGIRTGVIVVPLERVGVYAPGGTARYPSTVLMTAVPATVAGVREVLLASPSPPPETLYAARLAGVHRVFDLGGAQAIAALAYGTETVPRVDLVAGPGSRWVTAAKKLVYGDVGIDGLAGPSEAVIVADDTADPAYVAADLLTQAEHDEQSSAVLVTPSEKLAKSAVAALESAL
ncbi:MAG: histidinol dehydrogenase, partial [Actinobacteria bacterium]|nr:histidinol dehydrogenase [Actinomycetota bacterium]